VTVEEFAGAVVAVRRRYGGRVTSWGRTDADDAVLSGGIPSGPHPWDLAVDMIYLTGPNRPGSERHRRSPRSCRDCSGDGFGLKVIHEPGHDHYQPLDFPAGPVTEYAGEVKTWI
jgi:hypothetical protein